MAYPLMLEPPPVILQGAQHNCWACAFESWSRANERLGGGPSRDTLELRSTFAPLTGATDPNGRATVFGLEVMAAIGLMALQRHVGSWLSVERMGGLLERGYIYVAYFPPRRIGHAVVCYGANADGFHVMDSNVGYRVHSPGFFRHLDSVHAHATVMVGRSLGIDLAHALDGLDALRPPAAPALP